MKRDRLYASPLSRPPTSKATGIDRTMVKRKMELKNMLNSHHIGAAGWRAQAVPVESTGETMMIVRSCGRFRSDDSWSSRLAGPVSKRASWGGRWGRKGSGSFQKLM